MWHFPDTAAFVCQTTTIQDEHVFHNNIFLVWRHSEPLPLCTVLPCLYDSGKCWAVVNGAEPMLLKFLPKWQKQMGGGGMGKLGNHVESWGLGWFIPSQSSVVSQLTSRGTWRHLVPVWITVTVEGRGRDGSATTDGSSRTGEEASESWLNALTGEDKGAIGGPAGENIISSKCWLFCLTSRKN